MSEMQCVNNLVSALKQWQKPYATIVRPYNRKKKLSDHIKVDTSHINILNLRGHFLCRWTIPGVWYYYLKLDRNLFLFSLQVLINFSLQVYSVYFKCNKKLIREYPNLFNYTKDIYQISGISSTVNMEHIRKSYYGGHSPINPYGIIPVGPNIDYNAPHDREKFKA